MRRWLLIFLVFLLPMQFTWAAVASYCQHESQHESTAGSKTQHVGHHEHQHAAPSVSSSDHGDTASGTAANGAIDLDCGTCHASCCTAIVPSLPLVVGIAASQAHGDTAPRITSQPASLPERPNWADLA